MSQRGTKAEHERAKRQYLAERMGCEWTEAPREGRQRKARVVCRRCGRPSPQLERGPRTCRKRRRPNRWGVHFRRWYQEQQGAEERRRERSRPLDVRLMLALAELEGEAKHLPQDCRTWAFHPVPRRYRRIVKRLWALPALSGEAREASPSKDRLLLSAGLPAGSRNHGVSTSAFTQTVSKLEMAMRYHAGTAIEDPARTAQQAAHALRKIRPDLFEGYHGSTRYSGPAQ